jgi:tetratricopeptide (TPR) repeat protein
MVTSNRPALIAQAGAYFDQAIALDHEYADAWAGKGYALASIGSGGSGSSTIPASVYPAAIAAFRKALEIDPDHAFATGWLGFALMVNDFKWAEGMQLMKKSLRQEPNNAELLAVYGFYLDTLKLEGAAEVLERAYRLDPFSMEPIIDYAIYLMRQGRLLEAASLAETSLIKDRDGYAPNFFAAYFNLVLGRLERAEQHLQKARQVALPRDLDLDALQWVLEERQGKRLLPSFEQVWQRMQTERLSWAVTWKGWEDEESIVAVYNLAVEQRHPAIRSALFGPKPELMPEDEWRRLKEVTGVTQFQQSRQQ